MSRQVRQAASCVERTTTLIDISTEKLNELIAKNGAGAKLKRRLARRKIK